MNDKDKNIVNSYKQGHTPEEVKQNVSNKDGKVSIRDGKVTLHEGVKLINYEDQNANNTLSSSKTKDK